MTKESFALVGDIGGTNARFALVTPGQVELQHVEILACREYDNLDAAVREYLGRHGAEVTEACLAFACPVNGQMIRMTNNHWVFDRDDMQDTLGLETFKIVNDFTAMALGMLHVHDEHLKRIGGPAVGGKGVRLVIGPGTGLGVSALVPAIENWIPLATEGGHIEFGAVNEDEIRIREWLGGRFGRVSVERILCGDGLVNLYKAHCALEGRPEPDITAADVTGGALSGDPLATKVLNHFCEILGRVAGDDVLTLGAWGGVYLCGGILPRFVEFLRASPFRAAFERKGRMRHLMENTPVWVVTDVLAGLKGAAEALRNPEV
ncbi:MAG: glucokinase [Gammaproteobacteria bacterium]|nr:MAG: glucokinase [Gammaproteobacteria bacterium]